MRSLNRFWVLSMMLIAFLTQGLAVSAQTCEMMMNENQQANHQMSMSDNHSDMVHQTDMNSDAHSAHNMTDSSAGLASGSQHDCCGDDCSCPANACTSFSFVNFSLNIDSQALLDEKIRGLIVTTPNRINASLLRPPILS